jgi:hypothetical protein
MQCAYLNAAAGAIPIFQSIAKIKLMLNVSGHFGSFA